MLNQASILAVTLAMQTGQAASPPPQEPRWWKFVTALSIALAIVSMLALSGCSTAPATKALWSPPQAALVKSEPLPKLKDDPGQGDDAESTIGIPELVDDNFTLVKLYKRLAKRHDELVDAVMQQLHDQAK